MPQILDKGGLILFMETGYQLLPSEIPENV